MIEQLNMSEVSDLYDERYSIHLRLYKLIDQINKSKERNLEQEEEYLEIALGIGKQNQNGNWSSYDHKLGERILALNPNHSAITNLAKSFLDIEKPREMLDKIYSANLSFLKVSVGSEMAMMIKPDVFWTANVRTIWAHLLIKHGYDLSKANEELQLYRSQEQTSEMAYKIWREIYILMKGSIGKICNEVNTLASQQDIKVGRYLWFDAIASVLFNQFAG
jgi:hypothetical protein